MQNEWHIPELGPSKSFSLLSMQPEYWLTRDIGKVLYLNSCVRISDKIKIGRGTGCKCHSRISVVISYFWRNVKHVLHSFLSFFVVAFPSRFWTIQNHHDIFLAIKTIDLSAFTLTGFGVGLNQNGSYHDIDLLKRRGWRSSLMGKTLAPLLEQFVAERLASGKECSRSCGGKAEVVELRGSLKLYLARSLCKLCAEVD